MATLADLCLAKGISKIKLANGTELVFRDKVEDNAQPIYVAAPQLDSMPVANERMPTDDELMLYSTDSYDEIREQRKEAILKPSEGN